MARFPQQLGAANAVWSATAAATARPSSSVRLRRRCARRRSARRGGSIEAAHIVTGATFVFAAAALAAMPKNRVPDHRAWGDTKPLRELTHGDRTVACEPSLRLVVVILTFATLVECRIDLLVVVVAMQFVALGNARVGWLHA
jgi:hypothetical protein